MLPADNLVSSLNAFHKPLPPTPESTPPTYRPTKSPHLPPPGRILDFEQALSSASATLDTLRGVSYSTTNISPQLLDVAATLTFQIEKCQETVWLLSQNIDACTAHTRACATAQQCLEDRRKPIEKQQIVLSTTLAQLEQLTDHIEQQLHTTRENANNYREKRASREIDLNRYYNIPGIKSHLKARYLRASEQTSQQEQNISELRQKFSDVQILRRELSAKLSELDKLLQKTNTEIKDAIDSAQRYRDENKTRVAAIQYYQDFLKLHLLRLEGTTYHLIAEADHMGKEFQFLIPEFNLGAYEAIQMYKYITERYDRPRLPVHFRCDGCGQEVQGWPSKTARAPDGTRCGPVCFRCDASPPRTDTPSTSAKLFSPLNKLVTRSRSNLSEDVIPQPQPSRTPSDDGKKLKVMFKSAWRKSSSSLVSLVKDEKAHGYP
ncbi:hypothetical protein BZG36_02083 [Bifiguratus adelaidae]|uniref:Uncharacterized protein n=1 Tax=Bifiguratus adelaidae TaxID=1938954 RepID=A0A261Y399_9FUNG|nr:hypothetical protein BZG36_02083 [Bifiguratus adelaidae]